MTENAAQQRPPQDLAAEQGVLASVLIHGPEAVSEVFFTLDPGDFYDRRHAAIFLAMQMLWEDGRPVDEISLTGYLTDSGQLDAVGGPAFLAELADIVIAQPNADYYAGIVQDKSRLRRLIGACQQAIKLAHSAQDADVVIPEAQGLVCDSTVDSRRNRAVSLGELVPALEESFAQRRALGRDPRAVPTGLAALDRKIGGMKPGQLIVPAARPSVGKTSLMLAVALNVAVRQGLPVLFATREQSTLEIAEWALAREATVNTQHLATGNMSPPESRRMSEATRVAAHVPFYLFQVLETGERALRDIQAQTRALKARVGLALVVVDYIQQISSHPSKEEAISEISAGLQLLAIQQDVPVMAASQLNRKVEHREDRLPRLADLRGSGSLEQDAAQVWLIHRPAKDDPQNHDQSTHVLVAKNKGGRTGVINVRFTPEFVRFDDLEEPQEKSLF